MPRIKTDFGRIAFSSAAPQIWNHIYLPLLKYLHHLTPLNVTSKHAILPLHFFHYLVTPPHHYSTFPRANNCPSEWSTSSEVRHSVWNKLYHSAWKQHLCLPSVLMLCPQRFWKRSALFVSQKALLLQSSSGSQDALLPRSVSWGGTGTSNVRNLAHGWRRTQSTSIQEHGCRVRRRLSCRSCHKAWRCELGLHTGARI